MTAEPVTATQVYNRVLAAKMRLGLLPKPNYVKPVWRALPAPQSPPLEVPTPRSEYIKTLAEMDRLSVDEIASLVCFVRQTPKAKVFSTRRFVNFVISRHIIMFLAHHLTRLSYPQIGRALGRYEHSTIIHGVNKITKNLEKHMADLEAIDALLPDHLKGVWR